MSSMADRAPGAPTPGIWDNALREGWLAPLEVATFTSAWLAGGEFRLGAGYYTDEGHAALHIAETSADQTRTLGKCATSIFYPGRFKRLYEPEGQQGLPFLTPSMFMQFRPTSDQYLSAASGALDECRVKRGWILVTRSGLVGRCVIVGERLSHFAISDDAIRIVPGQIPGGYVYAFLRSWIGQALLSRDQYGGPIKHLEDTHVARLPLPLLDEEALHGIHHAMQRAVEMRDQANQLLDDAEKTLFETLGLPAAPERLLAHFLLPPPARTILPASCYLYRRMSPVT
jgi:type I restriction enzyme, S subunit